MCNAPSNAERLFAILENIVRYDLSDIKSELVRDNLIDARNLAHSLFKDELRAPRAALVEETAREIA